MGRRKIEMVRKEMLMVSLMAGGYPIDGKPKEHHNLPSGKQIVGFVVALIIVAAIAIFAGQTPAKTSQDAQMEVKTTEVQPAENAAVNAATVTAAEFYAKHKEIILAADTGITPEKIVSINNIPKEIAIGQGLYLLNLKITEKEITGTIENRDTNTKWHNFGLKILGFRDSGKFIYVSDAVTIGIDTSGAVKNGQPYPLSIRPDGLGIKDTKFLAILANAY